MPWVQMTYIGVQGMEGLWRGGQTTPRGLLVPTEGEIGRFSLNRWLDSDKCRRGALEVGNITSKLLGSEFR